MTRGGPPDLAMRAAVVELRNAGLSMAAIGARLRITKNAAAGHCHRAREAGEHVEPSRRFKPGWNAKPASRSAARKRRTRSRLAANEMPSHVAADMTGDMNSAETTKMQAETVSSPDMAADITADTNRPSPIPQRHRTCQFIAGEKGRDFTSYLDPAVFCGKPAIEGKSYCPEHAARCHTKLPSREGTAFVPGTLGAVDTAWR